MSKERENYPRRVKCSRGVPGEKKGGGGGIGEGLTSSVRVSSKEGELGRGGGNGANLSWFNPPRKKGSTNSQNFGDLEPPFLLKMQGGGGGRVEGWQGDRGGGETLP